VKFKKNILLKNYTTFRIGGPAEFFFEAKTKEDLIGAVNLAKEKNLPFFILGGGSNLLVSDKGYKGVVINFQLSSFVIEKNKIIIGAGARLAKLVNFGLEWAAGIPGTIGGAIYGNAGAFGESMENEVKSVEIFDSRTGKIKIFKNRDCQFGYRRSIFKNPEGDASRPYGAGKKNLIILSAEIKKGKSNLKRIKEYLYYRKQRHPQLPSAGSVFKNFQFSIFNFQTLIKEFPDFEQFKETRKVPAALLILKCGLSGKKIGQAQISEKHSNFIVNPGNAEAKDVIKLINFVKRTVKKKFKVLLKEEIQYLGFKN